jgi:hypothetical protein
MICPFSGKYCKECSLYRGRHYFLCFKDKYRGYIKEYAKISAKNIDSNNRGKAKDLFELTALTDSKSLDPFSRALPDSK